MKKLLKNIFCIIAALAVTAFTSCGNEPDYTMVGMKIEELSYSVPEHFVVTEHEEADVCYSTLNASIAVYSYTYDEIDDSFPEYSGDYTATDFAEFLVDKHGYDCEILSGEERGMASYTFFHTSDDKTYFYYNNVVVEGNEKIFMVAMSCVNDKLDKYADMFVDCLHSISIEEQAK